MKAILFALTISLPLAGTARADDHAPAAGVTAEPEGQRPDPDKGALVVKKAEKVTGKKKKKGASAKEEKKKEDGAKPKDEAAKPKKETRENGLVIEDVKVGTGMEAREGSRVTVRYRGTFLNGKEFDSNVNAPEPAVFNLERDSLIPGWVEGMPGMKVGGKRKLKVPYKLGYGERGTPDGTIPPKADLNFEIELIKVE